MSSACVDTLWGEWKQLTILPDEVKLARWSWQSYMEKFCTSMKSPLDLESCDEAVIENCLTCNFCSDVLVSPCTLQCGCTVCKSCCENDREAIIKERNTCSICLRSSHMNSKSLRVNVVLSEFINNSFSDCCKALKTRKRAMSAFSSNDCDAALKLMDESVELYPSSLMAWKDKASVLFELGRSEEALQSIERACSIDSSMHTVYLQKGKILHKLGRNLEAAASILISIAAKRQSVEANDLMSKVMMEIANGPCSNQLHCRSNVCAFDVDNYREEYAIGNSRLISSSESFPENPLREIFAKFDEEMSKLISERECTASRLLTEEQLKQLAIDFECNLCSRLLYEPITTPCGHVFCKECLRRWLDHNYNCPMCRFSLYEFVTVLKLEVTTLIERISKAFFREDVEKRAATRLQELEELARIATDTDEHIPIFVCCIALPSRPLQLQIFEPRYRLMLRQCLESSSRQFGICAYSQENGFVDYGTMVEVRNAYFVPDGRAFVECLGGRRFKVLSRGVKDGYNTAKVEWIKDAEISNEQLENVMALNTEVHSAMRTYVINFFKQRTQDISNLLQFPDASHEQVTSKDGPDWIWWLMDCFFESKQLQLTMIGTQSLEERLHLIWKHLELDET